MTLIPSPEAPVLSIGAATIDMIGVLDEELHRGTSNPAHIRFSFGGVARNVAENLARLGHPVTLISAVGDDHIGQQLLKHTTAAGVDVENVSIAPAHTTGAYVGILEQSREIQIAVDDLSVIETLTPKYLREHYSLFKNASLLFVDANLPSATLRMAFSLAKRAGIPVFADPTAVLLAHRITPYLSKLHLITPNAAEAAFLCGKQLDFTDRQQMLEAAKHLVSQGVEIALITLGEFGVCYATSDTNGYVPALRTEIVDPTGGGDALTATVTFALLNDIPIDDAVRLGASAASLTLCHRGAVLPDLSLEKLYDHLSI